MILYIVSVPLSFIAIIPILCFYLLLRTFTSRRRSLGHDPNLRRKITHIIF